MLPQVRLDDLDGDRRSGSGAETAALDYDGDSDRGVTCRREASEHSVVEARVVDTVLGGAGLARDGDAGSGRASRVVGRALRAVGHGVHHLGQVRGYLTRNDSADL